MKELKVSSISGSKSMPLKSGSLQHLQDSNKECFDSVMRLLIGTDYDSSKYYVLWGCENSGSGLNYTISQGAIFGNGVIYNVPATAFTSPSGEVAVLNFDITYTMGTEYDPVTFTDSTTENVHRDYIIIIESGVSGSSALDFSDLVRFENYTNLNLSLNSGFVVGSGHGIKYSKTKERLITINAYVTTSGSTATGTTIATLPSGFIPLLGMITGSAVIYHSNTNYIGTYLIRSNGDIQVSNAGVNVGINQVNIPSGSLILFNCSFYA